MAAKAIQTMTDAEKVHILRATIQRFLDAYAGEKRLRLGNGVAGQWYGEAEQVMEVTRPSTQGCDHNGTA